MNFKYKLRIVFICICIIAVMGCSVFWYYRQIRSEIYNSTMTNMQELAEHDLNSVQNSIVKNWNQLEAINTRMSYSDYSEISQMQERLHIEQSSSVSEKLYYVAQDGTLYSGDYMIEKDSSLAQIFEKEEGRFAVRYDSTDTDIPELQKECLLYGVHIQPWEIEGTVFVGMLGQMAIDSIQEELVIQCYGGEGYSSVVDENGYYIVNINRDLSFQSRQNFYSVFKKGQFLTWGMNTAQIEKKLQAGESFSTIYRDESGNEKVMNFQVIDQTNWYFIMEVSREVFEKQTSRILLLSLIAIFLVAATVIFSLGLWYVMMRKSLRAKAQLAARNEFLSNMSHEIRTPLNGLIGLNHLMIQNVDDQEKMEEYLKKSSHTAQYLLALVNDILDMSKLQAGKVELHLSAANLNMVLDNVVSMQKENIEGRGIGFDKDFDIPEPWIECDEIRLKQVLMNLLSNAGKFTPAGGNITLRVYQEKTTLQSVKTYFEVQDTGCGMSEEFQKHIFEMFTQEKHHNSESQKGTGLGMAISYLLMQAMGGTLTVESTLGKGSLFCASFTAATIQKQAFEEKEIKKKEQTVDLKNLNILIAEDNELNAEILTEILRENGITSKVARDGQEAVEKFAASDPETYQVILMDVQMPVMNGYEATKAIRSLKRADAGTVKILACTANTFQEDMDRAKECRMNGFIGKPIDIDELLRQLETM